MSADSTKPILLRKERYDYRSKKRKWEERRTDKGAAIFGVDKKTCQDNGEGNAEPFVRIKRKKYAMMMSYSGVDYYGMQRYSFDYYNYEKLAVFINAIFFHVFDFGII